MGFVIKVSLKPVNTKSTLDVLICIQYRKKQELDAIVEAETLIILGVEVVRSKMQAEGCLKLTEKKSLVMIVERFGGINGYI